MESLHEKISLLCEELGLPRPAVAEADSCEVSVETVKIQFRTLASGQVVLTAALGRLNEMAEKAGETVNGVLDRCLHLHGARLSGLALPFVLSLEPDSDEVILWVPVEPRPERGTPFREELEELLNEVEFRRNWMSPVTDFR